MVRSSIRSIGRGLAVCGALLACASHSDSIERTASAAPNPTPDVRARQFLQHQLDSATKTSDLVATFTPDAIVLVAGDTSAPDHVSVFGIGDGGPDGAPASKAKITKLIAEGNADAVWFYAEVTVGSATAHPTRVVELLVASEKWHAVAASFGSATDLQPTGNNKEIPTATADDGPLAKLLASTAAIGAQLAPHAIVIGPGKTQLASGAKAKAALAEWKLDPIKLYKRAREIRKPTWGFVQATFDHPDSEPKFTDRGLAQAFAVPKPDGAWSIVLVQYRSN